MKKIYFFTLFLLSVLAVRANNEPVIGKDQLLQIQEYLTRSEYFIHWQSNAGIYTSPNRKNSLRAVYTGQEMSITPQNAQQQWSFSLTVKGVYANGGPLYKPVKQPLVSMDENTIQFNHDDHFTVEYVNNEQGIRQNFIIQQPAVHTHKLSVQLQPASGWKTIKRSATSLAFKNRQQLLSYNDLKVWDANGKSLPAHFSIEDNLVQIEVDAENAIYPVTIDPIVLNGTPQNANTFLQSNRAKAFMGMSVSGAGDINGDGYDDVILGAPGYENGQLTEGAVFVYYGTSRGINPTTYTLLERNIVHGQFGEYLSGGGDLDGDGYDDIVIGVPQYSTDTINSTGSIYVYYGSSSGIKANTPDIISGTHPNGYFGGSVSMSKDLNGDLYDDIIVGESGASQGQTNEGTVTIVYGGPWGVLYTASTVIEGNVMGKGLGRAVSGAGDVNGDGYNDVLAGAYNSAYVYYGGPWGVETTPATSLTSNQQNSYFGYSLAGGGDINGDGYDDILIGASSYTNGQSSEGAVFVFNGSAAGIVTTPALILEGNKDSVRYGANMAFVGDINSDGFSDIIASATGQASDITQRGEGMAYVYYGRASGINPVPASTIQSNQEAAALGYGVDGAGDVNGDGYSDVLVGSLLYSNGQQWEGAGFIYHGGAGSAGLLAADPLAESPAEITPPVSVKTFPNPVVNNLSVQLQGLGADSPTYIQVMNAQGSVIQSIKAGNIKDGNQSIDLSKLTPGLYFVVIQNGSKVFREKIIKQ